MAHIYIVINRSGVMQKHNSKSCEDYRNEEDLSMKMKMRKKDKPWHTKRHHTELHTVSTQENIKKKN
ncbi:hypothetical protein BpHYR1_016186 [Brachionus plicatilis]|uniref:Uncharacterized protein n=1 Tax=Brachionus plicatilis TaxID=10195 RepID=A0A3M7R3D0_BRAPC|nr:hypothetical protein BpHYR1_016186 [Brachionus plicatilis]